MRAEIVRKLEEYQPYQSNPKYGKMDLHGNGLTWKTAISEPGIAYKMNKYYMINMILRDPQNPYVLAKSLEERRTAFGAARILAFLYRHGPMAPIDMTIYRGMRLNADTKGPFLATFQPGREVVFKEILSTTPSLRVAKRFAGDVLLILSLPKGTPLGAPGF